MLIVLLLELLIQPDLDHMLAWNHDVAHHLENEPLIFGSSLKHMTSQQIMFEETFVFPIE